MKKCLLLLLLAVTSMPMWAQDIIVTTESERIDGKVIEISDTEIKYKRKDNPNGPTFVLSTNKISSIIYKNGEVQTFKHEQVTPLTSGGTVVTVRNASDIQIIPGQQIEMSSRGKYYYGNIELDESLYKEFLKLSCPDAYKSYSSGEGMLWGGSFILGAGLGFGIAAIFAKTETGLIVDASLMGASFLAGIPLLCVGPHKMNKSLSIFNANCTQLQSSIPPLKLSLIANSNGFGFKLNF